MEYVSFADVTVDHDSLTELFGVAIDEFAISPAVLKQYTVEVPGANGTVDLSAWFGGPRYESRTLTIVASCCCYSSSETVERMGNMLLGRTFSIRLTVNPGRFYRGKFTQIKTAEASSTSPWNQQIVIAAICDPYCYSDFLIEIRCLQSDTDRIAAVSNLGTMPIVPEITAEGEVHLKDGASVYKLSAGTFSLPDLVLPGKGEKQLVHSGAAFTIRFREGWL